MIIHIDMDAFFASVEELDQPQLKGRPLVVGGAASSRGVVAAANYPARRFGVRSAMPMRRAQQLCPQLLVLPVRMVRYVELSRQIQAIFLRYTPTIEPLSLDEAFLDVAGSERLFGPPEQIARCIQQQIFDELGLAASVGVAPNKFLAKIASDLDKPNGFVVVQPDQAAAFLEPLAIERLWGVGKASARQLHRMKVQTIGDLKRLPQAHLQQLFGKHGRQLWQLAHGIDPRRVVTEHQAKSISNETTFAEDIEDHAILLAWLQQLTEQVCGRLRNKQLAGRTVQLKIRYANFDTLTRSHSLEQPSHSALEVWQVVKHLFKTRLPWRSDGVRLVGMGMSGFDEIPRQGDLFSQQARAQQRQIDATLDQIKAKFGRNMVQRGNSLQRRH